MYRRACGAPSRNTTNVSPPARAGSRIHGVARLTLTLRRRRVLQSRLLNRGWHKCEQQLGGTPCASCGPSTRQSAASGQIPACSSRYPPKSHFVPTSRTETDWVITHALAVAAGGRYPLHELPISARTGNLVESRERAVRGPRIGAEVVACIQSSNRCRAEHFCKA